MACPPGINRFGFSDDVGLCYGHRVAGKPPQPMIGDHVQVSRSAFPPRSSASPAPVIAPSASCGCGTASPHPSAGTGGRPRREPQAAARAAPTTPPRPKSPGTTTPPACGSSGPHVHSQAGQAPAPSSCSSGSPAGRNELTPGQRRSSCLAAPGQRPGAIANCPVPVALKMLLQLAGRNIRQLTDIEPPPARRRANTLPRARRDPHRPLPPWAAAPDRVRAFGLRRSCAGGACLASAAIPDTPAFP